MEQYANKSENEELRRRLIQREYEAKDPSDATQEILMFQLETQESLDATESDCTVIFNSEQEPISVLQKKVSDALQSKQRH